MPLVRSDLRKGKDLTCRQEIARVVDEALVAVGVPANARFRGVSENKRPRLSLRSGLVGLARHRPPR